MHEVITDHLDLWTSALLTKSSAGRGRNGKQEAYGIQKLRNLILELAVRGKLMPQDPNDEPAEKLLKRAGADKARMQKAGDIRREKLFPPIADDEIPFDVPNAWQWSRINDVGHSWGQKIPDADFTYIDVSTIDNNLGVISAPSVLGASGAPSRARKIVRKGTVIYSTVRPYLKNVCVLNEDYSPEPIASTAFAVLHPFQGMSGKFFALYFRSPGFVRYVESVQTGIAYPAINDMQFYGGLVPVPPLAEQHRIVAKVDELMALCDQLEQQQSHSIEAHQSLVETLLGTLTNVASPQELNEAWTQIADHFDTLFSTEQSLDQLKMTILQLAVMGKLVHQDPNDEPANKLLEKIASERADLIQKKKIKRHPPVEPFGDEYELPNSWETIVVQDFADVRLGSTPSRTEPKYWGGDTPWVSSGEVANCVIRDTTEKITQDGFANSSVSLIPKRSVLIAIIGQGKTRGQSAILDIDACTNQNVAALVFNANLVVPEFVWIWAKSKYESHRGEGRGGAQPALNGKQVRSFRFYLPPTAEQHRIVAKVDELMALCDALKVRLVEAQTTQIQLADAIVEQAVA